MGGRPWADEANGVYFYDNLVVLKTSTVPAVLFEAGVIVHPDEARELATAIDAYKLAHRRRFITYEEMLSVVKSLGYTK